MARGLTDGTNADASIHEETIQTSKGSILVARQGDPRKPALITYHDLGLNHNTNFLVSIDLIVLVLLFGLNGYRLNLDTGGNAVFELRIS